MTREIEDNMKYFPIFLNMQNKTALIFGGGADAAAKLRLLQKTEARLLVVTEEIETDVLNLGKATWIQTEPKSFNIPSDTALVYAATGNKILDAELVAQAKAKGVLACAVDQKEPSDFITPALVDRDPVVVAIGTEGTAPVLARDLKAKIETLLEPSLGTIAKIAARLRPLVAAVAGASGQRRALWHGFFQTARKQPERATEIGHALLANLKQQCPRLSFIHAPSQCTDLDEKAKAALHTADLVVFNDNINPTVLELTRREALQIKRSNLRADHAAKAFQNNHHVVIIRQGLGGEPLSALPLSEIALSEITDDFGIMPEVFPCPASQFTRPETMKDDAPMRYKGCDRGKGLIYASP